MTRDPNRKRLIAVAQKLGPLLDDVVFVGLDLAVLGALETWLAEREDAGGSAARDGGTPRAS